MKRIAMQNQGNNYESFVRLLVEEESAVKAFVRRLVPSWHDVEEIVQQASLIAWNKFDELDDHARFGGWLLTIARYEAMKHRRSLARSPLLFSNELAEQLADAEGGQHAADASRRNALEDCLAQLDAAKREMILEVYRPGVSIRQYAQHRSRPEQAVYKTVQRVRLKLLHCMRQKLAEEALA